MMTLRKVVSSLLIAVLVPIAVSLVVLMRVQSLPSETQQVFDKWESGDVYQRVATAITQALPESTTGEEESPFAGLAVELRKAITPTWVQSQMQGSVTSAQQWLTAQGSTPLTLVLDISALKKNMAGQIVPLASLDENSKSSCAELVASPFMPGVEWAKPIVQKICDAPTGEYAQPAMLAIDELPDTIDLLPLAAVVQASQNNKSGNEQDPLQALRPLLAGKEGQTTYSDLQAQAQNVREEFRNIQANVRWLMLIVVGFILVIGLLLYPQPRVFMRTLGTGSVFVGIFLILASGIALGVAAATQSVIGPNEEVDMARVAGMMVVPVINVVVQPLWNIGLATLGVSVMLFGGAFFLPKHLGKKEDTAKVELKK